MRKILLVFFFSLLFNLAFSQVFFTRTGHVYDKSQNNIKNIEADNFQIISTINKTNGEVRFEGLLKSFEFKLGALDRVFNSDRINVNQYPKFRFEGTISGLDRVDPNRIGSYDVEVNGTLYLWDEKRVTSATGVINTDGNGGFSANSDFIMRIEEQSMIKLNKLIDEKLPSAVNLSIDSFGVDRDIQISLNASYKLRNW